MTTKTLQSLWECARRWTDYSGTERLSGLVIVGKELRKMATVSGIFGPLFISPLMCRYPPRQQVSSGPPANIYRRQLLNLMVCLRRMNESRCSAGRERQWKSACRARERGRERGLFHGLHMKQWPEEVNPYVYACFSLLHLVLFEICILTIAEVTLKTS